MTVKQREMFLCMVPVMTIQLHGFDIWLSHVVFCSESARVVICANDQIPYVLDEVGSCDF